jgi:hypothetical protein
LIFCWKGKPSTWFTIFRCCKNCDVHFVTSTWWKRLSSFKTTMHVWHQRPTTQSRLRLFRLPPICGLERYEQPTLQNDDSPGIHA